jgi:hypothetical protein
VDGALAHDLTLRGFTRIADLAVDMTGFYRDIDPHWQTLIPAAPLHTEISIAVVFISL